MPRAGLDSEAVVSAAAELADQAGLDGVTLAGLASRLGIRPPSLYAHVDGLADLRARLGARGARELAATVQAAAGGRAGRDALAAVASTYRDYARAHPGTYAAMQRAPDQPGDGAAAGRELVEVLLAVLSAYRLRGDDAMHAVRGIRAALHGFVSLEREGGFRLPLSLDQSYDRLVEVLDRGLRAGGEGHGGGEVQGGREGQGGGEP
jgi:AcrR family transcriptional regulator